MRILDELRELEDYFMSMLKNGSHIVEIYEQVTSVVVKFTFNPVLNVTILNLRRCNGVHTLFHVFTYSAALEECK